jgi:hypothetical protein
MTLHSVFKARRTRLPAACLPVGRAGRHGEYLYVLLLLVNQARFSVPRYKEKTRQTPNADAEFFLRAVTH